MHGHGRQARGQAQTVLRHLFSLWHCRPSGRRRTVNGFGDLTDYLITHKSREFARALTAKLLTYALGRSLELGDEETVDDLTTPCIARAIWSRSTKIAIFCSSAAPMTK